MTKHTLISGQSVIQLPIMVHSPVNVSNTFVNAADILLHPCDCITSLEQFFVGRLSLFVGSAEVVCGLMNGVIKFTHGRERGISVAGTGACWAWATVKRGRLVLGLGLLNIHKNLIWVRRIPHMTVLIHEAGPLPWHHGYHSHAVAKAKI